jgi:hypothetical protein
LQRKDWVSSSLIDRMIFLVELSATLNYKKCIHGVASQLLWKIGFPNDAWSYKKRDRYKINLEDAIEEKMDTMFEAMFRSYMQNLSQKTIGVTTSYSESIATASTKQHWLHRSLTQVVSHR